MRGQIPIREPEAVKQAAPEKREDYSKYRASKDSYTSSSTGTPQKEEQRIEPVRVEQKIGRNDLCPCGSGKKYKHCHGQNL